MEAARRASLADEEVRQMRAVESATGASSSRNVEIAGGTTNSVVANEDTTEGVQTTYVVGSGELDPPTCLSPALCDPVLLHLPLSYPNFFMHWGQLHIFLLGVG